MPTSRTGLACDLCRARSACFSSALSGERLKEFRDSRISNTYRKRQVIFYEGHQPHGVFVVCTGRVKVYKTDRKGHQLTVRIVGPGEILGHQPLLAGEAYAETAEALEESTMAYVEWATFRAMLGTQPAMASRLFAQMARETRAAEDTARDMAMKSSRERLAGQLLNVRGAVQPGTKTPGAIRLPYTRQDLAELAGLAQETVIRLLTELEGDKVIALSGRQLTIMNGPALERLAGMAA